LFTLTKNNAEKIILDSLPIFGTHGKYSDWEIPDKPLVLTNIDVYPLESNPSGSNPAANTYKYDLFDLVFFIKSNAYIAQDDIYIVLKYPSALIKPTQSISSDKTRNDNPLKEALKGTLAISTFNNDSLLISGIQEDFIPEREFKIILKEWKTLENFTQNADSVYKSIKLYVYYKNTQPIYSISSTTTINASFLEKYARDYFAELRNDKMSQFWCSTKMYHKVKCVFDPEPDEDIDLRLMQITNFEAQNNGFIKFTATHPNSLRCHYQISSASVSSTPTFNEIAECNDTHCGTCALNQFSNTVSISLGKPMALIPLATYNIFMACINDIPYPKKKSVVSVYSFTTEADASTDGELTVNSIATLKSDTEGFSLLGWLTYGLAVVVITITLDLFLLIIFT
jgi:hypothetical protein